MSDETNLVLSVKIPLFEPSVPDGSSLVSALNQNGFLGEVFHLRQERSTELNLSVGSYEFLVKLHKTPIRSDVLESRCELSSWWPNAKNDLSRHTAFIEIVGNSPQRLNRVHESVAATYISTEIVKLTKAAGVYWGDGILNSASDFIELAAVVRPQKLIAGLWVNVKAYRLDDGDFQLCTFGLDAFECADIEIPRFRSDSPGQVVASVCDVIERLLLGEIALIDNQEIRWDNDQEVKVRYGRSFMNPHDCVAQFFF